MNQALLARKRELLRHKLADYYLAIKNAGISPLNNADHQVFQDYKAVSRLMTILPNDASPDQVSAAIAEMEPCLQRITEFVKRWNPEAFKARP